jgi:hypothetical protein
MRRTARKLAVIVALLGASAGLATAQRAHRPPSDPASGTRIVAPLADPAVVPGVGRCTSDGRCTVTDAGEMRPGSRHAFSP